MTLAPIFRSEVAEELLSKYEDLFVAPYQVQINTRRFITSFVRAHYAEEYWGKELSLDREFVFEQDFFLILFNAVCMHRCSLVELYSKLNYLIRGRIIAGDNLIDRQTKASIPLKEGSSHIDHGIIQMLGVERIMSSLARDFGYERYEHIQDDLDSRMLGILNTAMEIAHNREILEPDEMIKQVHEVIGGQLFTLGMIAPRVMEPAHLGYIEEAEKALYEIGTGFQIVDDLADLAEDLSSRGGNLVVSQVYHNGSDREREVLHQYQSLAGANSATGIALDRNDLITVDFRDSAKHVLDYARNRVYKGLNILSDIGINIDPNDADMFVQSIVGDVGIQQVQELTREKDAVSNPF